MRLSRGDLAFVAILILILVAVMIAALSPFYSTYGSGPIPGRDLEECEAHATTGTYTITTVVTSEISGTNSTETSTYTTTQVQFCT